eukprot:1161045-Pelagomonas_calceolata.AAC.8
MLNFLLAIIVDAFSEVKEQTQEGAHVPIELLHLFKDKWQSLRNLLNPKYISDSKVEALLRQWAGEDKKDKKKVTHERTVLKVCEGAGGGGGGGDGMPSLRIQLKCCG